MFMNHIIWTQTLLPAIFKNVSKIKQESQFEHIVKHQNITFKHKLLFVDRNLLLNSLPLAAVALQARQKPVSSHSLTQGLFVTQSDW